MAELIDPTQTGQYPVILGDGLMGKASNDIFTGIRYNHKPSETDAGPNRNARLKPSVQGQTSSYDLAINDGHNRPEYAFAGARDLSSDQYVLYFDPEREAFILDRIDSTFNMNVTRMPGNGDQESLSRKYPQLDNNNNNTTNSNSLATGGSSGSGGAAKSKASATEAVPKPASKPKPKPRAKSPPPRKKEAPLNKPKAKPEKKDTKKSGGGLIELALPKAEKPKPKPKPQARNLIEEEEDEDEDDPLLIEYPGGDPKGPKRDFSPALKSIRRFDDFMDQRESEADDADGESESEPEAVDFKLPSPVTNPADRHGHHHNAVDAIEHDMEDAKDAHHGGGGIDNDLEDDLEKDLEMAFEEEDNSYNGTPANEDVDESEISEED